MCGYRYTSWQCAVSGWSMVRLKGFGKFSGKYLVKQSRHDFTRHGGWTTELEIKMTEYVADEEKNNEHS